MKRKIFILVPSPSPSGPMKGAIALANALVTKREITIVTLKPGTGFDSPIDSRVTQVSLSGIPGGILARAKAYAKLLRRAGDRECVASISMCFSADMVNMLCRRNAVVCSSIRANLFANYRMDYGPLGVPLAIWHLISLGTFDHIVVMTSSMAKQVKLYMRRHLTVIGNFIDESALEPYRETLERDRSMRFVFLGSLTVRKQPLLLIQALSTLRDHGFDIWLDMIGTGPLMQSAMAMVQDLGLQEFVCFHGYLQSPHPIVSRACALVLPSLSEGVSRAAMEALHLGVPCVMRKVDGNAELIHTGFNGVLFEKDADLSKAMLDAAKLFFQCEGKRKSLIPDAFRQREAAKHYLKLLESET